MAELYGTANPFTSWLEVKERRGESDQGIMINKVGPSMTGRTSIKLVMVKIH